MICPEITLERGLAASLMLNIVLNDRELCRSIF